MYFNRIYLYNWVLLVELCKLLYLFWKYFEWDTAKWYRQFSLYNFIEFVKVPWVNNSNRFLKIYQRYWHFVILMNCFSKESVVLKYEYSCILWYLPKELYDLMVAKEPILVDFSDKIFMKKFFYSKLRHLFIFIISE